MEQELDFLKTCSPTEACQYLATKIRQFRRAGKESQDVFAIRAGVPLRTYKRFETHGKATLETFVRVLSAAGRTQHMFMIFPACKPTNPRPTLDEKLRQTGSIRKNFPTLGS